MDPGLLPFGMTLEHLHQGVSKIRNRVIARVFKELGIIEQWGSGVERILTSCKKAGLETLKFEEIGTNFRVMLFKKRIALPIIDSMDKKILAILIDLKEQGGVSTKFIAQVIKLSKRQTRTRMLNLVNKGLVIEVAKHPNDPGKKYQLSSALLSHILELIHID